MFRIVTAVVISAFVMGVGYSYSFVDSQTHQKAVSKIEPQVDVKTGSEHDLCHLDKSDQSSKHIVASMGKTISTQEQQPTQPPPSHEYSAGNGCSRSNPEAKPGTELNGVNPQTVGCKCAKRCVDGQTQEDLSRGEDGRYICKNACHKDRCTCPDPCKT